MAMVAAARIRPQPEPPWIDARGSVRRAWPLRYKLRLKDFRAGKAHSFFYNDEEVVAAVAKWLEDLEHSSDRGQSRATILSPDPPAYLKEALIWFGPALVVLAIASVMGLAS